MTLTLRKTTAHRQHGTGTRLLSSQRSRGFFFFFVCHASANPLTPYRLVLQVCVVKYRLKRIRKMQSSHPRRPRGKIIGREEDKTEVSVGAKVYFSCVQN